MTKTLTGTGRLLRESDNEVLLEDVDYRVHVTDSPSAIQRIDGELVGATFVQLTDLVIANQNVLLELEDGATWPCLVQNNSGHLVGRGKILPPRL